MQYNSGWDNLFPHSILSSLFELSLFVLLAKRGRIQKLNAAVTFSGAHSVRKARGFCKADFELCFDTLVAIEPVSGPCSVKGKDQAIRTL